MLLALTIIMIVLTVVTLILFFCYFYVRQGEEEGNCKIKQEDKVTQQSIVVGQKEAPPSASEHIELTSPLKAKDILIQSKEVDHDNMIVILLKNKDVTMGVQNIIVNKKGDSKKYFKASINKKNILSARKYQIIKTVAMKRLLQEIRIQQAVSHLNEQEKNELVQKLMEGDSKPNP